MKALFISYNQAYGEEIAEVLESLGQRGFTRWSDVQGRGSSTGIPRYGNHAWPEQNFAILSIVEDKAVGQILPKLRQMDEATPALGLRAFVWSIEESI
ncbi:MAG: hypothetical protein Q4B16_01290 [Bacteroidia bacterium]|nr:hypothetical protein [Bacteroidia bacterium]